MSHILPKPEASTTSEVTTLTNLTALGNGYVKKTGTSTFEAEDVLVVSGTEVNGFMLFDFGSLPTKFKCRDSDNGEYTYVSFKDGAIVASVYP
jgi:hypothetical protein